MFESTPMLMLKAEIGVCSQQYIKSDARNYFLFVITFCGAD